MKTFKILFFISFILLGTVSCSDDFINLDPQDSLASETAITDLGSLEAAVNGLYNEATGADYYTRAFVFFPDILSDNVFISSKNSGRFIDFDSYTIRPTDGNVLGMWRSMAQVNANSNIIIDRGSAIDFPESEVSAANQLIGEAYAMRGLAFFDMVRTFAQPYNATGGPQSPGVPVITSENSEIIEPARNTVQETYDQIIDDLEMAITLMDDSDSSNGRIDEYAVKALLSRVYMYLEDWDQVETYATDVIMNSGASLVSNENYIDMWQSDFTSESLFELDRTGLDFTTNSAGYLYDVNGYGDALVSDNLYDMFDDNDVRKQLVRVGVRPDGEDPANIVEKYLSATSSDEQYNPIIIRLAEVYLNRAEAYYEMDMDDKAQDDLDAIAQRANPAEADSDEIDDALLMKIMNERRLEFALEGHRLFDLVRRKIDFTKYQTDGATIDLTYYDNRFIMPIPQREMDANTNMVQNPGYN